MYTDLVMDHFSNPRNVGEVEEPDGAGQIGNPVCGDVMRMTIKVEDDRITDVKFKTFGCGAAVATSSMVTEMVMGKTLDEAAEISNRAVAEALGGLPAQKMHCSNLAADALHLAIEDYLTKAGRSDDVAKVLGKKSVVVGLSGGVDSAVAALALREDGYDVRAATVKLWPGDDERSCCSAPAVARARDSAHAIGAPHYCVNDEPRFAAGVVAPFVDAYLAGETPNPCIECNPGRFERLLALADHFGAAWIATGHYARIVRAADGARVARGRDRSKDQSYMLWRVPPETLDRLVLPLGELTKPLVRERARRAGLPPADEPDSQEVCFAPGDHREFLAARGAPDEGGEIVDTAGNVLGRHGGCWRFTVGQRRGLGVSAATPLYVLAIDAPARRVIVGPAAALATTTIALRSVVDRGLGDRAGLEVQLRYQSAAIGVAALRLLPRERAVVSLAAPFDGPAPGQSAVFYRNDIVVGGGIITSTAADVHEPRAV